MKNFFLFALVMALLACNDNETKTTTEKTDSTDHNAHQNNTGGNASLDTSGLAGKTLSSVMQSMMDNMKNMKSTGNPDNDFAAMMKAHHMGAIEMSQLEIARGTDAQIKQMAQKMLSDQQREIAELNSFLSGHAAHGGGEAFHKESMSIMNNMKMDMNHSGSVDKQFVQMMIPHHQTAIDMAKAYLKSGAHEEKLKTMANNIITAQQKEIGELNAWLAKNN